MEDEYEYDLDCEVCESSVTLIVKDGCSEPPEYCPMCGSPMANGEWG